MRRKELLNIATFFGILLFVLQLLASRYDLYFHLRWFDILMHFLGGLFVSLYFLWFYFFSGRMNGGLVSNKKIFLVSLVSFLAVAFCWEIFEYITDTAYPFEGYVLDTLGDVFFGLAGAFLGVFYFVKKEKKFL